jgi:hypothetical protein
MLQQRQQKKQFIKQKIISKRTCREHAVMVDLVKKLIGKECLIYTMNSQLKGVIREVTNGGMVVDDGKSTEIVNLDYIIRVRESKKSKN